MKSYKLNENFKFAMDYEFYFRIKDLDFVFIREFLGGFRIHNLSKTSLISRIGKEEHRKILVLNGYNPQTIKFNIFKKISKVRRALLYTCQGDFEYVFRGIFK